MFLPSYDATSRRRNPTFISTFNGLKSFYCRAIEFSWIQLSSVEPTTISFLCFVVFLRFSHIFAFWQILQDSFFFLVTSILYFYFFPFALFFFSGNLCEAASNGFLIKMDFFWLVVFVVVAVGCFCSCKVIAKFRHVFPGNDENFFIVVDDVVIVVVVVFCSFWCVVRGSTLFYHSREICIDCTLVFSSK